MKAIKYILSALVGMAVLASCDSNITDIEYQGYTGQPKTIEASAISSEALPGAIRLNWTVPADSSYSYMKVSYVNPANNETVIQLVSIYTNTLIIENTLKKYGDYTFTFQAFNEKGDAGSITTVKAQSGLLPASYVEKKVNITADQLSTDNQEPTEGPIKNLIDGNTSTFFHTRWSSPQVPLPQYIQISFNEEHENFAIKYTTRNTGNSDGFPIEATLQISSDGTNWKDVANLTGLPTVSKTDYASRTITPGKKFKYFRFLVTKTSKDSKYFHMSEFSFYDVQVSDPENE